MLGRVIDSRSDIFSVGSLAYELLTYQQAFKGTLNDGLLHRLPNEDPPPPSEVDPTIPAAVSDVVMRALQKDPDKRFQNLDDMRAALQAAQSGGPAPWEDRTIAVRRADIVQAPGALDFLFEKPPDAYEQVLSSDFLTSDAARALRESTVQTFDTPPPASPAFPETPLPHSQILERSPKRATPPPPTPVPAPAPAPGPTVSEAKAVTIENPPSTTSRPAVVTRASARAARRSWSPPAPQKASGGSGKWIGFAMALLVVAGGVMVAIPNLTEQPDPAEVERARVVGAMESFRSAYRTKNLTGVAAVFPSLPRDLRQRMQAAFARCLIYDVRFSDMQVELNPQTTEATVRVTTAHECTPNSDQRQTTTTERDVFTLSRNAEHWQIESLTRSR
jgi:hypothetical protein